MHRVHCYDLEIPHAAPRFLWAALLVGYGMIFAGLAAIGWTGHAPSWISSAPVPVGLRIVLFAIGTIHALHGTVVAAEQFHRGWALLGQQTGAYPVLETAGPCRLLQTGSHWDLHLALTDAPLWSEMDEGREQDGLYFPLDEADVAEIARLFDPGEEVAVRWVDLPLTVGGPTLLGLQTSAREELLDPVPADEADTGTNDGFLRAA